MANNRGTRAAGGAVLNRLREGPLSSRDAHTVAADGASLRVQISALRKRGYKIFTETRYVLEKEPEL